MAPLANPWAGSTGVPAGRCLLEAGFPYAEISRVVQADRGSRDGVYAAHKWWARRPPALIRALLLGSMMPARADLGEFWRRFTSSELHLEGVHVGDPFHGGGTTLVEASRLGASVTGTDVDPLAVEIVRQELADFDVATFERSAAELMAELRSNLGHLYPAGRGRQALHYFSLREAECPDCECHSLVYRNLVLARDTGLTGGVVRDAAVTAFCPDCHALHYLKEDAKEVRCCGRRHKLTKSSYARGRFTCPQCSARFRNDELQVGRLRRVLIAVEETGAGKRRVLRAPTNSDLAAEQVATALLEAEGLRGPGASLEGIDGGRVANYGFQTVAELFTARQTAVFASAFLWLASQPLEQSVRRALTLGVTNALTTNNLLCGYATNYGRISALFAGVRSYAMPVLSVELNPLHPEAGRGTLERTLARVARTADEEVRRHSYDPASNDVTKAVFLAHGTGQHELICQSAERPFPDKLGKVDFVLTDPPYYDYIPYSDLSLLHRSWLELFEEIKMGGAPIYPLGDDRKTEFAKRLGRAFRQVARAVQPTGTITFTFHSTRAEAWDALTDAVERSPMRVSAVFPVWADGRAVAHGHDGNCEWDLVFVCRRAGTRIHGELPDSIEPWTTIGGLRVGDADLASFAHGLKLARELHSSNSR
jgi:putative DNA methylase